MALAVFTGIAVAACLLFRFVDTVNPIHRRESPWLPAIPIRAMLSFFIMEGVTLTTLGIRADRRTSA
ncbi:hypothetical protein C8P69_1257 [Phreatobacter oligotrophus]|uniref:Uncharacterized protein n=1 Tax=Phreatobacter oligotrophus TaxID=1122261 RepID=A0A2T4YWH0_9HYPH|nr:hypothetical protein C8P69_1257 [Phreatobacter oligotrophus]